MLENLITDRSPADVDSVRGLAEAIKAGTASAEQVSQYLNTTQKGAYTHEDLNRVEAAVEYVSNRLKAFGYDPAIRPVRTWSMEDKPTPAEFARYFWNIAQLRSAIAVWPSTPETPDTMIGFDVYQANALEQILVDVDLILDKMQAAWFFLGELYSAEV
jgi:hypothetical protein